MTRTWTASLAIAFLLLWTAIVDPYGWLWFVSYDVGIFRWWKTLVGAGDVLLLTLLAFFIYKARWSSALRVGMVECAFAWTAGLFIAHGDIIRNAWLTGWLPGLRVLLGLYVAALLLRVALVFALYRAVRGAAATPDASASVQSGEMGARRP